MVLPQGPVTRLCLLADCTASQYSVLSSLVLSMADHSGSCDRYLPFNLSTIVPFEATAAALRALPSVQPRAPATPSLLPDVQEVDCVLDSQTRALMLQQLAETAREWYALYDSLSSNLLIVCARISFD
jgi:hypothetical protein